MFNIGDRVVKTSPFVHIDKLRITIRDIGTVIDIHYRHRNTKRSYPLYIVQFDGKSLTNEIKNQYTESNLKLFKKK